MKNEKEKIKQGLLIFTAVILIGIGYLNYDDSYNKDYVEVASRADGNEINLGDVELVNANAAIVENNDFYENKIENSLASSITLQNEEEENKEISGEDYFEKTRIEREKMYSQMIETYQKMLDNSEVSTEQKSIAGQEITNLTKLKNGIMISENLIKNKEFEDVVILVNNNVASVIVKARNLKNEEIAQIQNIVSRELKIEASNINISNK